MIKSLINNIENEKGEFTLLCDKPYDGQCDYLEFSLKTGNYEDIVLKLNDNESEILKFLLIYRIIRHSDVELSGNLLKFIILDNISLVSILYKLKKSNIDLEVSIADIVNFRMDDLVSDIVKITREYIENIDENAYTLINLSVDELDSLLRDDYNIEDFKKARYKVFSIMADELVEYKEEMSLLSKEETMLVKSTILSLSLKGREHLYKVTKDIIREMTGFINEKLELNSESILECVKEHKEYKAYLLIKDYDENTLITEELQTFYEKLDMLFILIPYFEIKEDKESIESAVEIKESGEGVPMSNDNSIINEESIIKEVEKFKNIIPSAKSMTERYYNRRREIIDSQFKFIIELFNNVDLARSIQVDFTLIEEVRDYLLGEGYELEVKEDENITIIKW